jgi:succinoglycan biosynthesis protein ExoA
MPPEPKRTKNAKPEVATSRVTRISVIAPMLNEVAHVDQFIDDIAAQEFSGELELIVADGGSTDGSAAKLIAAAQNAGLALKLVDNPGRRIPHGLNACLKHTTGDLIVRLDCHSRYPPDYLSRCKAASEETGAWTVGGIIIASGRTPMERAVACAMETPFGGIGMYRRFAADDSRLRRIAGAFGIRLGGDDPDGTRVEVDTVTYGAFLPMAFERVGLFDESLQVDEDEEFNLRVRRAGGKVILDPSIHVRYVPRGSLRAVFRQYYEYGRWKMPVLLKHSQLPNPRPLAPIVFLSSLLVLAPAAATNRPTRVLLSAELLVYGAASVAFAAISAHRRREQWRLVPRVAAVFPTFHLAYGLGMMNGALRAFRGVKVT